MQQQCSFRHRGYQLSDGTITMVFGNEAVPTDPGAKLLWDNWCTQHIEKVPYAGQDLPVQP